MNLWLLIIFILLSYKTIKLFYGKLTKNKVKPKKLTGQKHDVKLCPSLYSDILLNSIQQSKSVNGCAKFAMIGKESLLGLVQTFRMVEKIQFRSHVAFNFGEDFMVYEGSEALLRKLIQFSVPYVKCVEFYCFANEWYNVVFDVLSKESKQKTLLIYGLPVVNDKVKTALTNMVEKGVLIEFKNLDHLVVLELPPCRFESLTIDPFISKYLIFTKFGSPGPDCLVLQVKRLNCSFRKLNFPIFDFSLINENFPLPWRIPDDIIVVYAQEIHSGWIRPYDCTMKFFKAMKRVFPNVNTLKIDLSPKQVREQGFEEFEDLIVEIKEAIHQASQENIHILFQLYDVHDKARLIEFFDGKKIDEITFEWKMESNKKKTIKIKFLEKFTPNPLLEGLF
uniref:DUF38 domain-containing protein n=1 Tax=Panagrolaimus sp. JU765 TaxID=591449 RepID=A0AC34PW17_9BILA